MKGIDDDDVVEDWSQYACPNARCKDRGVKGKGNVRLERRYGKNSVALLRCRTCKGTFSENRGTPFFGLRIRYDKLYQILTMLVEGAGLTGTSRAVKGR